MADIINLLPDSVANQIAAGEVIQRPASAVKELLENAVDAGANQIKLLIKDAGKTLIQVIDNGCGMSPTDARMCFERHATSKIRNADDLFRIKTMGFRGEALASIAAIAQVELKTRVHDKEIGSFLIVEGTKVIKQTEEVLGAGTSFAIKNLFFNTPARRNFLKSDMQEIRHITEEFYRVALIHPDIEFSFFENGRQKFLLHSGSLKQRIVALFGKAYTTKLLSVEETTTVVNISGFVGKPETARKTRGEQYFFVNERFIRHPYLHHAVASAFEELIPEGSFPSYFIHLTVDPEMIDVNIHPTKTEVNFRDEKAIYSILRSAVKMSLGKFALSPQFDFELEQAIDLAPPLPNTPIRPPKVTVNPNYNPFENSEKNDFQTTKRQPNTMAMPGGQREWQRLFEDHGMTVESDQEQKQEKLDLTQLSFQSLNHKYLVSVHDGGILLIDRQSAHERVLYDRFAALSATEGGISQKKIFPDRISLSAPDADLVNDLLIEIRTLGFEIVPLQNHEFDITGAPPDLADQALQPIFEGMLEFYKLNQMELRIDRRRNVLLSMARNLAIRPGQPLASNEISALIDALADSAIPYESPSGKLIITELSFDEITNMFKM